MKKSKWFLYSPAFDTIFFFMPFVLALIFAGMISYLFPSMLTLSLSPIWFFLFTIIFDVGHVWGTLYRTYFHTKNFRSHRGLLIGIPVLSFIILTLAGWVSSEIGRDTYVLPIYILAWFAVFHFIKQHVGFMLLYMRKEVHSPYWTIWIKRVDTAIVWVITGIPMLYWWSHYESISLEWFERGEFSLIADMLPPLPFIWIIYWGAIFLYITIQCIVGKVGNDINPLKYLYLIGTALVWYLGIVHFDSAIIFGFGNILVHGMNYYGIIIGSSLAERKSYSSFSQKYLLRYALLTIPLIVICFGIIEEYFWDQFVWQASANIFGSFFYSIGLSPLALSIIIGLLGSIQFSHYILDRYIWRKDFGKIV